MTKKIYNAINETEFVLVEDPQNKRRTTSNEKILVSEIPNAIFEENFIITPGQGKIPASILSVGFVKSEHFPTGKCGYNSPRDIPISPASTYNQRFLNFNHFFASYADYILLSDLPMSSSTYV